MCLRPLLSSVTPAYIEVERARVGKAWLCFSVSLNCLPESELWCPFIIEGRFNSRVTAAKTRECTAQKGISSEWTHQDLKCNID